MFKGKKILVLGAHPDDIEFGMGATLNQIKAESLELYVLSNTFETNTTKIFDELIESMKLYNLIPQLMVFNNMKFVSQQPEICNALYHIRERLKPDIVFCTSIRSVNPDHRVFAECVEAVFQESSILFYETPRGDFKAKPTLYNIVSGEDMNKKVEAIMCYNTQTEKRNYANSGLLMATAEFRGGQINQPFAEAFEVGRFILDKGF